MKLRLPNKNVLVQGVHRRFTVEAQDAPQDPVLPVTPGSLPVPEPEDPAVMDAQRNPRLLASHKPIPSCFLRGFDAHSSNCAGCHAFQECGAEFGEYQATFGPMITLSELSQAVSPLAWEPRAEEPQTITVHHLREVYNRLQSEILEPHTQMKLDLCIPSHRESLARLRTFIVDNALPLEPFLFAQMATLRYFCSDKHVMFRTNMCHGANALERYRVALLKTKSSHVHITEDALYSALPCGVDVDYKNLVLAESILGEEYLPRAVFQPGFTLAEYLAEANWELMPRIWWLVHKEHWDVLSDWHRRRISEESSKKFNKQAAVDKYRDLSNRARCEAACMVVGYYGPNAACRINVLPGDIDILWEVLATPCRALTAEFRKTHKPRPVMDARAEAMAEFAGVRLLDNLFTDEILTAASQSTYDGSDKDFYVDEGARK